MRLSSRFRSYAITVTLAAVLAWPVAAQRTESVDLDAIYRIKEEGLERSQVMEVASYLTDVHGPRLTGSPNIRQASEYARAKLEEWGLASARLEPWGEFGRGWTNDRFVAHAIAPRTWPIIGYSKAWTPGTDGPVTAEAVLAVIENESDFEKHRGTLRGKFVLTHPWREVRALFDPQARRFSEEELATIARQPDPSRRPAGRPAAAREREAFARKRMQFFLEEGVAALLEPGRGDGGAVFVMSGGSRRADDPPVAPQVVLAVEHYGRLARTLQKQIPVTLEMDIRNTFHDADLAAYNVLAEIPGTDKADEVVMLGAHFDSWHAGTGATDNAAGSAVMMEAVRILMAADLDMRRTVRIALWSGEEQGLLGSRAYVKEQFGDRETMQVTPAHAKLSGYFNVDNGTGAIRGIYLQGNEAAAPVFEAWMQPFANMGMTTLSIRNTGGTDHLSFDAVGLPGFQFIQDPMEYSSRTHHSSMDVYERLQPADLMQNAAIVATFVYHAANRDERLPRKPLPAPTRPATPAQTTEAKP
jgi:carboxypeptidase Q